MPINDLSILSVKFDCVNVLFRKNQNIEIYFGYVIIAYLSLLIAGEFKIMRRRFGFIHEKLEIKILILFILRRLTTAIPIDMLAELTLCDDGISYFDFMECVEELVSTEHIIVEKGMYSITEKGARNGETTENSLPFSVRQVASNAVATFRSTEHRDSMIKTLHMVNDDGTYTAILSMSDGLGDVIKIELHSVSEQQATELENGFHKNAEKAYNALIKTILT